MIKKMIFSLILFAFIPFPSFSQETNYNGMFISTLYSGVINNKYDYTSERSNLNLEDSGLMTGLYLQYLNPEYFQVNGFFYYSPDVNYSKVYGAHLNGDGYFLKGAWGSLVAGLDVEYIRIRMDAEDKIYSLEDFRMNNDVLFTMARFGAKVNLYQNSFMSLTALPYAGITRESVKGTVWVNPSGPEMYTPLVKSNFSDTDWYPSWGINLGANLFHFIDITLKYLGRAQKDNYMNSFTGQINVYPTRNFVLSYQYKYMDVSADGCDEYHILGAGAAF